MRARYLTLSKSIASTTCVVCASLGLVSANTNFVLVNVLSLSSRISLYASLRTAFTASPRCLAIWNQSNAIFALGKCFDNVLIYAGHMFIAAIDKRYFLSIDLRYLESFTSVRPSITAISLELSMFVTYSWNF